MPDTSSDTSSDTSVPGRGAAGMRYVVTRNSGPALLPPLIADQAPLGTRRALATHNGRAESDLLSDVSAESTSAIVLNGIQPDLRVFTFWILHCATVKLIK